MGQRNITFANDEYYHVFNRGVDKRVIFNSEQCIQYFIDAIDASNSLLSKEEIFQKEGKLVEIIAYCLLPNHFHLLLKQVADDGISKFMQKLGTSYTKYFNAVEKRSGGLFQGKFKATHIEGDFALPVISTYVNLNYKHHQIDPEKNIVKSSIFEYLNNEDGLCNKDEIQNIITECDGLESYKQTIKDFSIAFADNKGISLNEKDFEF